MFRERLILRASSTFACCAAILLCAETGWGQSDRPAAKRSPRLPRMTPECAAGSRAYRSAQESERAGRLRDAAASLETCAQARCPGLARICRARRADVSSRTPSVVPVVTDEHGDPRVDVEVRMD